MADSPAEPVSAEASGHGDLAGSFRRKEGGACLPWVVCPGDVPRLPSAEACGGDRKDRVMRTLHVGIRVADADRSLAFYTGLGYEVLGEVPETDLGSLTMLKLPGDEFVTLELV